MPVHNISSGLPILPPGLKDKDASLVTPVYKALNTLATNTSIATGVTTYSPSEMAQLDQFTSLTAQRAQVLFVKAEVDLAYGKLLNLSADGAGKLTARLADASAGTTLQAHAICDQVGGITAGNYGAAIFMQGISKGITGSSLGVTYYLSTSGQVQTAAPTTTGALCQIVGTGISTAGFYLNIMPAGSIVTLAYLYNPNVGSKTIRFLYADGTHADIATGA